MRSVLTLIADPATAKLSPETAAAAWRALSAAGASVGEADWLAPGIACDIPFAAPPAPGLRAIAREVATVALAGRPVDAVLQNAAGRRKKLLVADMESTIIVNEMADELAALLGIGAQVAAITRRAMNGEIRFKEALRERVALLGGLEEEALKETCERIVFMPGAKTLVATMRKHGARAALVSGGFRIFTGYVAPRAGFDWHYANDLVITDGVVAGTVSEPILGREAKREALVSLCCELDLDLADTLAVGDGANDIDMIRAAGMGVAFRAKPVLKAAAAVAIEHGDLTALLYLQGYRKSEFAAGGNP
jgi:phosphoserine phosphatase